MEHAWIAGEPAALDTAIAEAAKLLASSRHPLIAGLGTDVAGARAAVALAERLGGVIDHVHADPLLRNLDVMRSSGVLLTTPSEARVRADTLLLVGTGLSESGRNCRNGCLEQCGGARVMPTSSVASTAYAPDVIGQFPHLRK
jgi:formylmethanofuran dehydrogenase subunit B